jgi:hypothetical protein
MFSMSDEPGATRANLALVAPISPTKL